jgi:hypothetical protein
MILMNGLIKTEIHLKALSLNSFVDLDAKMNFLETFSQEEPLIQVQVIKEPLDEFTPVP